MEISDKLAGALSVFCGFMSSPGQELSDFYWAARGGEPATAHLWQDEFEARLDAELGAGWRRASVSEFAYTLERIYESAELPGAES